MLGFHLAVRILDLFGNIIVSVQIGNAIDAGDGGFAKEKDLVAVFGESNQPCGLGHIQFTVLAESL